MRYVILLLLLFTFSSCKHQKENKEQQAETPKALQENKEGAVAVFSKRISDDLVDDLYDEKLGEIPGLKSLDKKFNDLNKAKMDSLAVFHKFDSQNDDYYRSVHAHLDRVQDSFLKEELKTFFENNKTAYSNSIRRLKGLEEQIDKQYISAIDKRIALKLFITLNVMNEFRNSNMPSALSLDALANNYRRYNASLDSAVAKNKQPTY